MEVFTISIKEKVYEIRTPLLKGDGNIVFSVFENDKFILSITPDLKNNRLCWTCVQHDGDQKALGELSGIGKGIEAHIPKTS